MELHDDDPLIQSRIPIIVQSEKELIPAIEKSLQTEYLSQILQRGESFAKILKSAISIQYQSIN